MNTGRETPRYQGRHLSPRENNGDNIPVGNSRYNPIFVDFETSKSVHDHDIPLVAHSTVLDSPIIVTDADLLASPILAYDVTILPLQSLLKMF
ncbi:hypothetical protein V6N13_047000 [Hibiscus sabdariffa]|uniref:Uncharacterized protein n=2 Tax=Hibiscus sabdariffa TaxID=183260 RepID=A0ABR1ZJK2_9ROSI